MEQYRDHPMDLADASLIVAAESLRTTKIFTLDRTDFRAYHIRRGHRHIKAEIRVTSDGNYSEWNGKEHARRDARRLRLHRRGLQAVDEGVWLQTDESRAVDRTGFDGGS